MFETHMTVVGKLVTGVDQRRFADGSVVANFRVVSTERRYDRTGGGWTDGDKLFLDVTCWRRLAENAFASLVKGDAVVVTGRLYTREFEHEGRRRSTVTLEAQSVAADLAWCTAVLNRTGRRAATSTGPETHGDDQRASVDAPPAADVEAGPADDASRLVGAAPGGEG
jgi:single-strand DNA-binding protein